jgi:hypothetical protein
VFLQEKLYNFINPLDYHANRKRACWKESSAAGLPVAITLEILDELFVFQYKGGIYQPEPAPVAPADTGSAKNSRSPSRQPFPPRDCAAIKVVFRTDWQEKSRNDV